MVTRERGTVLLDSVAKGIIEQLQQDGRRSYAAIGKAMGQDVGYVELDPATFRGFGFPGADDLGNMFQFNRDFATEFCAAREPGFSRSVNPKLQTFEQWLAVNAGKIPAG